jgi:acetyl esterase/lipase
LKNKLLQNNIVRFSHFACFALLFAVCLPVCARSPFGANPATEPAGETVSIETLRNQLASLETRLAKGEIPADPQNLALLKFKLEQAHLWLTNLDSNEPATVLSRPYEDSKKLLQLILQLAENAARARGDAVYPSSSQLHERAYIASNDGSAQPYWIFVPRNYSPKQKWPLVVFLHGYSPDITKIEPWLPGAETWMQFTERGFILAVPYGRRNSDFVNIGEDDTLTVTREVQKHYSVDVERTFLLGPSMGGYGVYAVGLHHPDVYAALSPMCGRTDMYLWFNLERRNQPAWKQIFYDGDEPRRLIANARHLPIFIQHGSDDQIVNVEHSRRFYADAKALKLPVFYHEIPGASHYIYWNGTTYSIALDWLKKLRRAPEPARVEYSSGSLRNNKSYWVAIDGFEDYSKLAHIDAAIQPGNIVEVMAGNVSRFTLRPPLQYLTAKKPIRLVVNGVEEKEAYDPSAPLAWPRIQDERQHKSSGRCGPIKEVYRDPFLLVYGTQTPSVANGLQAAPQNDVTAALRFRQEWQIYADGVPPMKADSEVTEEDKRRYNLVLFGTRDSNLILKAIADELPFELKQHTYRVGDQELALNPGDKTGLQFCYPSPFSSERMIVVQSGYPWGEALPVNHKYDMLPEFIVYTDQTDFTDNTNAALLAGFFDDTWHLPANLLPTPSPQLPLTQPAIVPSTEEPNTASIVESERAVP